MESSRFSTKVKANSTKRPEGVSRREGMWLFLFAVLIVLFVWARILAKDGQSWISATIYFLVPLLFVGLAIGVAVRIVSNRGVQPRGWRIRYVVVTIFSMLCAAIAEFFWPYLSGGGGFDVVLAALLAGAAGLPFAFLAAWKIRVGS